MNRISNTNKYHRFIADSKAKAFDEKHRSTIAYNMLQYDRAVKTGKSQFRDLDTARKRIAIRKYHVMENLEDYLRNFELNFTAGGGKVVWAQDSQEACKAIIDILENNAVKHVVKSKSMVSEEVGLTEFLEKNGIECMETDLGEYIVQLLGERPYHIVTPAMHLSADDVAKLFHERFGLPKDSTPADITEFVRTTLRKKFSEAQAGITGANFLISGNGAIAITENEGNALFSVAAPSIHIVLTGIEKIVPSLDDLDMFWPMLSANATGQNLSAYNTLVFGPKKTRETDGPTQVYVILLDNGRTNLLANIPQRRSLSCIRCGACLNACPVYRNIGGHAYGTVYSGPIGAIVSPLMTGNIADLKHLSHASSLCGKCTEVCPAGIDLHHQLLYNRQLFRKKGLTSRSERIGIFLYKKAMIKRKRLNTVSHHVKNLFASILLRKTWGRSRTIPKAVKSFNQLYQNI